MVDQKKAIILNVITTIIILVGVTFLAFFFKKIAFHESNIIIAYILGVLIVAKQTDGYIYGIIASILGVLTFNYFFTEPYFTFYVNRADYPVTFAVMLITAIITSTLTTKVKHEALISFLKEQKTQLLYQINKDLLQVRTMSQITEIAGRDIGVLLSRSVIIVTDNPRSYGPESHKEKGKEHFIYSFNQDKRIELLRTESEMMGIDKVFETILPCGFGTSTLPDKYAYYVPIIGHGIILGVVGIDCFDKKFLTTEQKQLLDAVLSQIALAIERERLWEKQQKTKLAIDHEKIKSNLLRAVSHDLRTPLTSILGATSTILENEDIIDKDIKRELLQNVYEDTSWLIHTVENILSITRIDDGKINIKKTDEAIEEIVGEAISRVKELAQNHKIKITIPDELIMIPMDGILIEQVLINLLDNAIKYTPKGSLIEIKVFVLDERVVFEVSDNGPGIQEENKEVIFERFYTNANHASVEKRGTGLGLAICKSIIIAHGGEISVYNNSLGGATFQFTLDKKEV